MDNTRRSESYYAARYHKSWETRPNLSPWLQEDPLDSSRCICRVCGRSMRASVYCINLHARSARHARCLKILEGDAEPEIVEPPTEEKHHQNDESLEHLMNMLIPHRESFSMELLVSTVGQLLRRAIQREESQPAHEAHAFDLASLIDALYSQARALGGLLVCFRGWASSIVERAVAAYDEAMDQLIPVMQELIGQ